MIGSGGDKLIGSGGDKLIRSVARPPVRLAAPVAPPRAKHSPRNSPNLRERRQTPPTSAPTPLPRTNSLRQTQAADKSKENLLIQFDSVDSTDGDIFDPLASNTPAKSESTEEESTSGSISRDRPSRNSLSRTKAFRRESIGKKRTSYVDNSSDQSTDDLFGDLAGLDLSGSSANQSVSGSSTNQVPAHPQVSASPNLTRRKESNVDLMQEWSLDSLPKSPAVNLNLPMMGNPAPTLIRLTNQLQNQPNANSSSLTRYSSYSYNSIRPKTVANSPFLTGAIINTNNTRPQFQSTATSSLNGSPQRPNPSLGRPTGVSTPTAVGTPRRTGGAAVNSVHNPSVNSTNNTGVNKLSEDLFSDLMPSFSGGQKPQSSVATGQGQMAAPQTHQSLPAKQQNWTTFD